MKRRDLLKSCLAIPFVGVSSAFDRKSTPIIEPKTRLDKDKTVGRPSGCPSVPSTSIYADYPLGTRRVILTDGRIFRYVGFKSGYKNKGSFAFNGNEVVGGKVEDGWMQTRGIMDVYYLRF